MPIDRYFVTFLSDKPIKVKNGCYDVIKGMTGLLTKKTTGKTLIKMYCLIKLYIHTLMPQYKTHACFVKIHHKAAT